MNVLGTRVHVVLGALVLALGPGCVSPGARGVDEFMRVGRMALREGKTARAEELYAQALAEARRASLGPDLESAVGYELGRVKGQRCKTDEARALLARALERADEVGASARVRLPRILEIAYLESNAGRYAEALPYFERGIAMARSAGYDSDPSFADVVQAHAIALERSGERARAESLRREAVSIPRPTPEVSPPLPFAYRLGCATVARERGDYAEVLRQHEAVLAEALPGSRARLAGSVYESARAAGVLCRFEESETRLREVVIFDRQSQGPVQIALVELARLNLDQKKYAASLPYFEEALTLIEQRGTRRFSSIAFAVLLEEYALALEQTGATARAEPLRTRARALRTASPGVVSTEERTPYATQCR